MEYQSDRLRLETADVAIPIFFPSISSIKTALSIEEYVLVLNSLRTINSQFLISAYDIAHLDERKRQDVLEGLAIAKKAGVLLLMDSGNYESYWKGDQEKWTQQNFHKVLEVFKPDLVFTFDNQNPPSNKFVHVDQIASNYSKDKAAAGNAVVIPIVHGAIQDLPELCAEVVAATGVEMLAVAERRLGGGILERVHNVSLIRQHLNKSGKHIGLHLLGTGNPISIAVYAIAGADSFDGLEWCQTVVDHESALLLHLSHGDLLLDQTSWGGENIPFSMKVLAHNLQFYASWMTSLRSAIHAGDHEKFCRNKFPLKLYSSFSSAFKWAKE